MIAEPSTGVKWPPTCSICYHIIRACHALAETRYRVASQPLQTLIQSGCMAHKALFRAARIRKRIHPIIQHRDIEIVKPAGSLQIDISRTICPTAGTPMTWTETFLLVKKQDKSLSHPGRGLVLDEEWINQETKRTWYETCRHQHHLCQRPSLVQTHMHAKPQYLVDTVADCIVQNHLRCRYVALSYVWGGVNCLKTKRSKLEQLQIPGAFRDAPLEMIPRTIQHSMEVVRLLGERYLWVDSLCIVQDDEESTQQCLDDMAAIYANAALTIKAVEGDNANHGLRGVRSAPLAVPRSRPQEIVNMGRQEKFARRVRGEYGKAYEKRAWIFQESLLSHRVLEFSKVVSWRCAAAEWTEDVEFCDENRAKSEQNKLGLSSNTVNLHAYSNLVQEFNTRKLTYPEDRLSAFAGITNLLSVKFYGGFLCGLPRMFFDTALLWHPNEIDGASTSKRRMVSSSRNQSSTGTLLPSWSWAGWEGLVDLGTWLYWIPEQTVSIVAWYSSSNPRPSPGELYDVAPMMLQSMRSSKAEGNPLPEGWVRKPLVRDMFEHPNFPGLEFSTPFPIGDFGKADRIPTLTPYLHGATERSWLFSDGRPTWVSAGPIYLGWSPKSLILSLYTDSRAWAGVLRVLQADGKEYFRNESLRTSRGYPIELIAISRGYLTKSEALEEQNIPEGPKDDLVYEFYNVLWIEWANEIAYRRALGRVRKDAWESLKREVIQITLG
jgi:hypothetical protein